MPCSGPQLDHWCGHPPPDPDLTPSRVVRPQEFNIEKLQMVESEKQKIRKEFERKESQVEVKKKM